jgi:hypothetical protein
MTSVTCAENQRECFVAQEYHPKSESVDTGAEIGDGFREEENERPNDGDFVEMAGYLFDELVRRIVWFVGFVA